jgi:hypothetical protein
MLRSSVIGFTGALRGPPAYSGFRAWAWLAAETDDLTETKHCLEAMVALDPSLDWAQAALTRVWHRWLRAN